MEFRLVYEGKLRASGNKARTAQEKHIIRKQFHLQLAELWELDPLLNLYKTNTNLRHYRNIDGTQKLTKTYSDNNYVERKADDFAKCGFRFIPLISKELI